jgi:predicted amidohydrolase
MYGHSMVVSPRGEILAELDGNFEGSEIGPVVIDLSVVNRLRRQVPLMRGTGVYPEVYMLSFDLPCDEFVGPWAKFGRHRC